jgi:hypothetical protein
MLGNLGQLTHLLRNAGQIKENMKQMQERLKAARFEADAGAGQVTATVDGRGEMIALKIDPALIESADRELIEDLTVAAVRAAVKKSRSALQEEMQTATGGMDLSGLTDMLG